MVLGPAPDPVEVTADPVEKTDEVDMKLLLSLFFFPKDMHKEKWDMKTIKCEVWKMDKFFSLKGGV